MHQLQKPVLSEFQRGSIVVKRSVQKFNQVDPDQAMEWYSKERRWNLWYHEDNISALQMYTFVQSEVSHHS